MVKNVQVNFTFVLYSILWPGLAFSLTSTSETNEYDNAYGVYRWFRNDMLNLH